MEDEYALHYYKLKQILVGRGLRREYKKLSQTEGRKKVLLEAFAREMNKPLRGGALSKLVEKIMEGVSMPYMEIENYLTKSYTLTGGDISKAIFEDRDILSYRCYATLVRDYLVPSLTLKGSACAGTPDEMDLLFKGANGFALKFICTDRGIYTIKMNFEMSQMFAGILMEKDSYMQKIREEYMDINKFNSPHIMKGLVYFFYEPRTHQFEIYKKTSEGSEIVQRIPVTEMKEEYKQKDIDGNSIGVPFFGGVVLENVERQFVDLPKDNTVLMQAYQQYVEGIEDMNKTGHIHRDIKPDNLMFNLKEDGRVQAKIIDLGEVYNVMDDARPYNPASQELCNERDWTTLGRLTQSPPSESADRRTDTDQQIIRRITNSYDLYCLGKSFLTVFSAVISPAFQELLENTVKEKYEDRYSNSSARIAVDELLRR